MTGITGEPGAGARMRPAQGERYGRVAIWFHWTIAALVLANLAVRLLHEALPRGWMGSHKAIGLTVLALTAGRIAWRLGHRPPPLPAHVAAWEKGAAHATHWTLYLLLLAMPLSGWIMASGGASQGLARPLTWFGLFDWPYLPVSQAAAERGHGAHAVLAWVMLTLVVLHVAAALRHHLLLRDAVLLRMAPGLRRG